jgi:hypothetical protein
VFPASRFAEARGELRHEARNASRRLELEQTKCPPPFKPTPGGCCVLSIFPEAEHCISRPLADVQEADTIVYNGGMMNAQCPKGFVQGLFTGGPKLPLKTVFVTEAIHEAGKPRPEEIFFVADAIHGAGIPRPEEFLVCCPEAACDPEAERLGIPIAGQLDRIGVLDAFMGVGSIPIVADQCPKDTVPVRPWNGNTEYQLAMTARIEFDEYVCCPMGDSSDSSIESSSDSSIESSSESNDYQSTSDSSGFIDSDSDRIDDAAVASTID